MNPAFQSPLAVILSEVNRLNPTWPIKVTPEMVEIVSPALFLGPGGITNTRATMQAKAGALDIQYFTGNKLVYYNRRNLSRVCRGLVIPGSMDDYTNSRDIIDALVARYRIPMDRLDVTLSLVSNPASQLLSASSSSIAYIGSITLPYEITE